MVRTAILRVAVLSVTQVVVTLGAALILGAMVRLACEQLVPLVVTVMVNSKTSGATELAMTECPPETMGVSEQHLQTGR